MKKITVIGFGKIGQAVAANILRHGYSVTAIDIDQKLSELVRLGQYHANEPGLQEIISTHSKNGSLVITSDYGSAADSEAIIVSIPLLIDNSQHVADRPFLESMEKLAPFLSNGVVVIIETSIPVGFSREFVLPVLEKAGKKHGVDFWLAHSPERIKSGTMLQQLATVPKVIGGIDSQAASKAKDIYQSFFPASLLHVADSIEAAELLKLAGMIYRDVNIALSNQLAQFANAKNINFSDLVPLINTDGEANLLYPGIGVGGHCTPVYPYFLIENFRQAGLDFTLARQGRLVNNQMAAYAVSLVKDKVQKKNALILGLSFRPNVREDSLSTAYVLHEALVREGFTVKVHDTEFTPGEIQERGLIPATDIYATGSEVVFLVTMHREYHQIDAQKLSDAGVRYFVDGRNNMDKSKMIRAGIIYQGIGH